MLVRGNNVTLAGMDNEVGGAGIHILNGLHYCLEGPTEPDTLQVIGNTLVGPEQTFEAELWSGLRFDWACGPLERLVYVAENDCSLWDDNGMTFLQSSDTQVSCNLVSGNRKGVSFSRNTEPVGSGVRFRKNDFADVVDAVFVTDNALMLKLGPDVADMKGRNRLSVDDEIFIRENDPDPTRILNAKNNRWLIGGVATTDTTEILELVETTITDSARVVVDGPLESWSGCSGQGQGEMSAVEGGRSEVLDTEQSGLAQEGVVGLRIDIAPPVTGLDRTIPNPTEGVTEIWFSISEADQGWMALEIFDIRGRLVKILAQQQVDPGHYRVYWSGRDKQGQRLAAGVYFVRMQTRGSSQTKKMVLLR